MLIIPSCNESVQVVLHTTRYRPIHCCTFIVQSSHRPRNIMARLLNCAASTCRDCRLSRSVRDAQVQRCAVSANSHSVRHWHTQHTAPARAVAASAVSAPPSSSSIQKASDTSTEDAEFLDPARPMRVLIAGGGIAGLVLAVALLKKGVDVRIFEQDMTAIRGEGKYRGPIQVRPFLALSTTLTGSTSHHYHVGTIIFNLSQVL